VACHEALWFRVELRGFRDWPVVAGRRSCWQPDQREVWGGREQPATKSSRSSTAGWPDSGSETGRAAACWCPRTTSYVVPVRPDVWVGLGVLSPLPPE
jgi:hypothetical protein